MTDPQAGTGPETITEAEPAEALAHRSFLPDPDRYAGEIFGDVRRSREPEYETGAVYQDRFGDVFKFGAMAGRTPWLGLTGQLYGFDHPVRPLRKLVPEGRAREREAHIADIITEYTGGRLAAEAAGRICKLLEASDD